MLVTSIFSFSHDDLKRILLHGHLSHDCVLKESNLLGLRYHTEMDTPQVLVLRVRWI